MMNNGKPVFVATTVKNRPVLINYVSVSRCDHMMVANLKVLKEDLIRLNLYQSYLIQEAVEECPQANTFYFDVVAHKLKSHVCWVEVYVPKSVYFGVTKDV